MVEGTSYNGQNGEAPPKGVTFFKFQVCERKGVSLVEVYERIVNSVIVVCTTNGLTGAFYCCERDKDNFLAW